jgi:DNA polymerase III subunit delta
MKDPVWLLLGPELGEKGTFLDTLRKDLAKEAGGREGIEEYRFYFPETKPEAVVSVLQNGSLFSEIKLVRYEGLDAMKSKSDLSALTDYIKKPAQGAVLIILSDSPVVDKALKEAIRPERQKIFWEMFENRKEEWIQGFFRKEGLSIDADAVETILELVENNTAAFKAECSRLALFFKEKGRIEDVDVESYISHNRDEDPFSLFDRMVTGSLEQALEVLSKILFMREYDPVGVIGSLAWSFRKLASYESLASDTQSEAAFAALGIRSKNIQKTYREGCKRYPLPVCERIVAGAVETDAALRSGNSAYSSVILELFIYGAMSKKGNFLISGDPDEARIA